MTNPFEVIELKLDSIEKLILNLQLPAKALPNNNSSDELLGVAQAAEFLKLSIATIYTKVSRGELPVMKRGKRLYFSKKELLDYLKKGRRKTTDEIEAEAESYLNNQ